MENLVESWSRLKESYTLIIECQDLKLANLNTDLYQKSIWQHGLKCLKADSSLCLLTPAKCLHCHRLLCLSIWRAIFDKCHDKDTLEHSGNYKPLFDSMVELIQKTGDRFASYEAQKTLTAAFKIPIFKAEVATFIKDFEKILQKGSLHCVLACLEICKELLSMKNGQCCDFLSLYESLIPHVGERSNRTMSIFIAEPQDSENFMVCYASVWMKIVKIILLGQNIKQGTITKPRNSGVQVSAAKTFHLSMETKMRILGLFSKYCLSLIDILFDFHINYPPLIGRILKLMNTFFTYCHQPSVLKDTDNSHTGVASYICSKLQSDAYGFEMFPFRKGHVGFGGVCSEIEEVNCVKDMLDMGLLRRFSLLCLQVSSVLCRQEREDEDKTFFLLRSLDVYMCGKVPTVDHQFDWLSVVYQDQDDTWVEVLLLLLDIYVYVGQRSSASRSTAQIQDLVQPHNHFKQFLSTMSFDHSVIVDLLTSPETCFLMYLTRYLKYTLTSWEQFVNTYRCKQVVPSSSNLQKEITSTGLALIQAYDDDDDDDNDDDDNIADDDCGKYDKVSDDEDDTKLDSDNDIADNNCGKNDDIDGNKDDNQFAMSVKELVKPSSSKDTENRNTCKYDLDTIDQVMSALIRVRIKVEKLRSADMFPYNPEPLLKWLNSCEEKYEDWFTEINC